MRAQTIRALLRIQLLMSVRDLRQRFSKSGSRWALLLLPVMAFAFVPIIAMFLAVALGFYQAGVMLGQPHAVLVFAFTVGQLAALSFGVLYVLSTFYFGRDLRLLLPLPLRAGDIVLVKFLSILAGELLTMAPMVLPAVVVYGVLAHVGFMYWTLALLIYLLLPVPALVLASLFSFVLMRLTRGWASRDLLRVLGGLLGILVATSVQFLNRFNMRDNVPGAATAGQRAAEQFLTDHGSLTGALGRFAPTSLWAADALRVGASTAEHLVGLLLFLAVAALGFWLLLWFAERVFFGGLAGIDETPTRGKVLTQGELAAATGRSRAPLVALLQREVRLVNRNPSFLMAALVPPLLLPVFIWIPLTQEPRLRTILATVHGQAGSPMVPLIAIAAVLFMGLMGNLPATAISREGRQFWISRMIPIAPRTQVLAKLGHHVLLTAVNLAVALGALAYVRLLTPGTLTYTVLGGVLGGIAVGAGSIMVDLLHPHLNWTDPQQAMKGNINVLGGMILTLLVAGLAAGVAFLALMYQPAAAVPAVLLTLALLATGLTMAAGAMADRRYTRIEG
ncbi:MAG: putative ABC transporter permease subunit [Symbiobacteriia bacterium]